MPYNPNRSLNILQLARISARKLSSAFYDSRQIYISLVINAGSRIALDQALDSLNAILQGTEQTLVISQSGTSRQYTATFAGPPTVNNPSVGDSGVAAPQGGYYDITLTFECSDSFGYDTVYTPIYNLANQSGGSLTYPYNQGGSADTQAPFIQIQYTGGGLGAGTVVIGNQSTGQAVSITRTWALNDIIQINPQANTVQVNGVDTAFSGAIPFFGLGAQTIYYTDTMTTRLFKIFAYVYNKWV